MDSIEMISNLAKEKNGKIEEIGLLPDDSGFACVSFPLPKKHWLYQTDSACGYCGEPPAPMRMGIGPERSKMAEMLTEAGKYAVRASTRCGKDDDFDPDALIQNLIVGMLGYETEDGYSHI